MSLLQHMNDIIGHYLYEFSYFSYMAPFIRDALLLLLIGPNKSFANAYIPCFLKKQDETKSYPVITRY